MENYKCCESARGIAINEKELDAKYTGIIVDALDEDKGFCVSIVIPDEQLPRFMRKIARNMRDETLRTLRVRL